MGRVPGQKGAPGQRPPADHTPRAARPRLGSAQNSTRGLPVSTCSTYIMNIRSKKYLGLLKRITNGKKVLVSRAQCGSVTITMRCTHSREDLFSLKPIQEIEISPCSYTP